MTLKNAKQKRLQISPPALTPELSEIQFQELPCIHSVLSYRHRLGPVCPSKSTEEKKRKIIEPNFTSGTLGEEVSLISVTVLGQVLSVIQV